MNGYGIFSWVEGKKYVGYYKNDKRDGFGFYLNGHKLFIGFWKEGKQNGFGKLVKDNVCKYGYWRDGKNEKLYSNENEFYNEFTNSDKKYMLLFRWKIIDIKKFIRHNDYRLSINDTILKNDNIFLNNF